MDEDQTSKMSAEVQKLIEEATHKAVEASFEMLKDPQNANAIGIKVNISITNVMGMLTGGTTCEALTPRHGQEYIGQMKSAMGLGQKEQVNPKDLVEDMLKKMVLPPSPNPLEPQKPEPPKAAKPKRKKKSE